MHNGTEYISLHVLRENNSEEYVFGNNKSHVLLF